MQNSEAASVKPLDEKLDAKVNDLLKHNSDEESSSLSHRVIDEILSSSANNKELEQLSVGQLKKLVSASTSVSENDLHDLLIDKNRSEAEKKAGSIVYGSAAFDSNSALSADAINKTAAAILCDEQTAARIKDQSVQTQHDVAKDDYGIAAGLAASMGTYMLSRAALGIADKYMPLPPVLKFVVAAGSGVLFGGLADNHTVGRDLLDDKGYIHSTLSTGFAGFWGKLVAGESGTLLRIGSAERSYEISAATVFSAGVAGVMGGLRYAQGNHALENAENFENQYWLANSKLRSMQMGLITNSGNAEGSTEKPGELLKPSTNFPLPHSIEEQLLRNR